MAHESAHDRMRLKQMHRFAKTGVVLAVIATGATALLGASGAAGAAVFFLLTAFGCVLAALVGLGFAIADEIRRLPVALRRIVFAVLYFAAAAASMVATVGAASGVAVAP